MSSGVWWAPVPGVLQVALTPPLPRDQPGAKYEATMTSAAEEAA